jgi:hypothetical protein
LFSITNSITSSLNKNIFPFPLLAAKNDPLIYDILFTGSSSANDYGVITFL